MPKKMLVAVDLSKLGQAVVTYGHSLAHRLNVETTFIHVMPAHQLWKGYEPWFPPNFDTEIREIAEKKIAYFVRKAEEDAQYPEHKEHQLVFAAGDPGERVIEYAKEHDMDLIVVGYKGQSTLEQLIVGSTASKIARYAPCSVLIYRPGFEVL